jgi:8-oxo-dGTP pyrophosphatase MutT (NUDIX family)
MQDWTGMIEKHGTASTFVFHRFPDGWRLALIEHPRYGRAMIPGGHVEVVEAADEAALREVAEETGLRVRLIYPPCPPLPMGYSPRQIVQPWWIDEVPVPRDSHATTDHLHTDHLYVAVADSIEPASAPAHPVSWRSVNELPELDMFEDTRQIANVLFSCLDLIASNPPDAADVLRLLTEATLPATS